MPKDNEVDEKVTPVAWRYWNATPAAHVNILGPGQYEYIDAGKWRPDRAEPLYSAATVAELRAEVETCRKLLAEKVTAETLLRELHITPAGMAMQVEGGMAGVIAQCLVDQFHDIGGPNFFEMKFSADQQQYVLTVQRYGGLTPADKMKAAQQRADAAERRAGELEAFLRILWEEYEHAAEYMGEGCLGVDQYRRSQFEALTGADPT